MQKTSGEIEKEFIAGLKGATGKDLAGWLAEIDASGIRKRNDIVAWLKSERSFGHMNASLLAGIHGNNGNPVYGSADELLNNQFAKAEEVRPLFDELVQRVRREFPDCIVLPKKTYVSITGKREFAAVNIKKNELRLGLDLGDRPFDETVTKARLTGPMPRISHQVVIRESGTISEYLVELLRESYDRTN